MTVLLLSNHSITPCTFKGDISASAIVIFGGLFSFNVYVVLIRLPLAALVAYPIALNSTSLHRVCCQ